MIAKVSRFQNPFWGLSTFSKLLISLPLLRLMLFPPGILESPAHAPGFGDHCQFLVPKIIIHSSELITDDQFHILALYVWVTLLLPRGKLIESPAPQNLVHLVLRIRMTIRKL